MATKKVAKKAKKAVKKAVRKKAVSVETKKLSKMERMRAAHGYSQPTNK